MTDGRRRLRWYLALVVGVILAYAMIYDWAMAAIEGRPRDLIHSIGIVIETFTTTGFGSDAPWDSAGLQVLMIAMQLTGVSVIFLALPLFVAPWVEERLRTTVQTAVDLDGHVVLCELSSRGETLIDELDSWAREYVVVEPNRDRAATLQERGITVIHGDPESTEALRGACVGTAEAVVADGSDDRNASIVLSVRELDDDVRVVAFAEDPDMANYLDYAGADEVFSPHRLLGESLANRVRTAISAELGDTVEIGTDFELVELSIRPGSEIEGVRLAESGIRERTGANVVGLWRGGEFESPPDPAGPLDRGTIVLVAGSEPQLEALKQLTTADERGLARGHVIVVGHDEVGSTVRQTLAASEVSVTVIDYEAGPEVDVVGDPTNEEALIDAGIERADTLILALSDDTATMLATLVAVELNPDVEIIARAEEAESIGKVYRAGADYVLALGTVSGRMTASTLLDEEVISPDIQIEVVRTTAPELEGQSLGAADIRSRTGCTVVAIERNGTVVTDLDPGEVIGSGDTLIVAGTDEAINRFNALAQ